MVPEASGSPATPQINVHDLGRLRDIAAVLVRHGFGQLVQLAGLEVKGEHIVANEPVGRRIRKVLTDLGPTYVKLGQVLSVRPDIVPKDILIELAELRDQVPPDDFEQVREVLHDEFGAPLEDVFSFFDPAPVASASMAQVHRARLLDGRTVAVKVQRPGIGPAIRSDIHILYSLAHLLTGRLQLPGIYSPVEIVQEFDAAITMELDFIQEARAARRFNKHFADHANISAPVVYGDFTTGRVLVQEFIEGCSLFALDEPEARAEAMRVVIECTYLQIFENGFYHGDPHPGNLKVQDNGRVVYLDFGLTGTLTAEMQQTLVQLFLGLIYRDAESVAMTIYRAGATQGRVDLRAFRSEIERLLTKYHGASLETLASRASLMEFVEVAGRYRIRLPQEYAILARAGSILDGMARQLLPADVDVVEEVRPFAQRLLQSRLSPEQLSGEAFRVLHNAQYAFRELPTQASQLLDDLQRGTLAIQSLDPESDRLRAEVRHAGIRVSMALCAASMAICGAILLAGWDAPLLGFPVYIVAGVLLASMGARLFVGLVLHTVMATRVHPRDWGRRALAVVRFFFGGRGN